VAYLFARTISIKNNYHPVGGMAIAVDELSDEQFTSSSKTPGTCCLKRRSVFDDVIAIDQDIAPHTILAPVF
jgi:hypothetical protein